MKTFYLIVGIIAVAQVLYSFWGNPDTGEIFGFEVNIWIYRLFWSVIAIPLLYGHFKRKKKPLELKDTKVTKK